MPRYDNDSLDAISVMEELNPEPEERPGASRMKEFVLGLLVIIGVLGWALGTWWHDEGIRRDYDKAQQAASAHRWDDAFTHFTAAKGYMDADARAAEASKLIQERDKQYEIATDYRYTGPAVLALRAGRAVQTIEPGYKDVDDIVARAKEQVYSDALLDTVVMRSKASPSGLYYRGRDGWIYLQDSDKWSAIIPGVDREHILYDAPGPNWKRQDSSGPNNPADSTGLEDKEGRRLIVATLDSDHRKLKFQTQHLNPTDYYHYIVGEKGVWGLSIDTPTTYLLDIPKGPLNGLVGADYEEFASEITRTVGLKGKDGVIADLGQRGSTVLLAGHSGTASDDQSTEVYAAGPDGSNPRAVFSTVGVVISAQLSPDERYALVVSAEPNDKMRESRITITARLLDLAGSRPPVVLSDITLESRYAFGSFRSGLGERLSISGAFLEKGAFKDKLLLGWLDGDLVRVRIFDLATPDESLMRHAIAETTFPATRRVYPSMTAVEQPDGRTLILYEQSQPLERGSKGALLTGMKIVRAALDAPGYAGQMTVSEFSSQMTITEYNILSPGFEEAVRSDRAPFLGGPLLRDNWLVYTIYGVIDTDNGTQIYKVYSLRSEDMGNQSARPRQVFDSALHFGPTRGRWSGFVTGPSALAYIDEAGTLHARLYGADADVVLEEGVDFMYPVYASNFYKALR